MVDLPDHLRAEHAAAGIDDAQLVRLIEPESWPIHSTSQRMSPSGRWSGRMRPVEFSVSSRRNWSGEQLW